MNDTTLAMEAIALLIEIKKMCVDSIREDPDLKVPYVFMSDELVDKIIAEINKFYGQQRINQ